MFLFGKIADQMAALLVVFRQHIEQERLHIVVQRFVIQKQLRQQTQILTVDLVHVAIDFEHRQIFAAINFGRGRMSPEALVLMSFQNGFAFRIFQAKLAQEQLRQSSVLLRKRTGIPGLDFVLAEFDRCRTPALYRHRLRR